LFEPSEVFLKLSSTPNKPSIPAVWVSINAFSVYEYLNDYWNRM